MAKQANGWLRDRDMIGAWAFRVVATGLLALLMWNASGYTHKIDELAAQVPVLANSIAMLTNQISAQQNQIGRLWERMLEENFSKKK